ncbi:cadmium-translocating P-type ATPase [Candidatus Daviesbacteria bacterium]|nr:cadmium-translocating P-type ATPase [Candidatus Daviesbacteria bacterium]
MNTKRVIFLLQEFWVPAVVLLGIFLYLALNFNNQKTLAVYIAWAFTLLGSFQLFQDTFHSILKKHFALDYIAILAIAVSLYTGEYLVALILALMIASGRNLESYAANKARESLTKLTERIPDKVILWEKDHPGQEARVKEIQKGMEIFIKKGEVIPLDGNLVSQSAFLDESSLTGEAQFVEKVEGDQVFSGTINMGSPLALKVTRTEENSTYNKIIELVKSAQEEKSPLVRLADKYSTYFTVITLALAGLALFTSNFDLTRALAVLAIATPCPLIIATPIALLGGVNAAAKGRIIVKRLASIELLSRINMLVLDKTGTITIGKPKLKNLQILSNSLNKKQVLAVASALERNSLHPLAKAVVDFAKGAKAKTLHAKDVEQIVGKGISGFVEGQRYTLAKLKHEQGMAIALSSKGKDLAIFEFEDEIKADSKDVIRHFKKQGIDLLILTGDKRQEAEKLIQSLGGGLDYKAEYKPEDKLEEVNKLKKEGKVIAMVGDGINDAPALAASDVGIVFSNEEQTAASEAADVVFLGGEFSSIGKTHTIAKQTIKIAKQSILGGIGLSLVGMFFAAFGFIPPIIGAILQEVIDVTVIINAIRASRIKV